MRFNRDFKLIVRTSYKDVVISSPMRINFTISKSVDGLLSGCTLKLYNLQESLRLALVKDAEDEDYIPVSLFIGYKDKIELAFKGNVYRGQNERSSTDMITTLECLDGGSMLNAFVSETITKNDIVIDTILKSVPTITRGRINPRLELIRPKVLVGNPINLINSDLRESEKWFIEDEQLNVIDIKQVTSNYIPKISAKTGLIETPTRQEQKVTIKILINPSVKIGRLLKLESTTAPHLNGIYKIYNITYNGDNYGQSWYQTCTGFLNLDYEVV